MKQILSLLILFTIFFSGNTHAQQKATFNIKGVIVDTTSNTPAQYSTLSIATKAAPDKQVKVLSTDDKGSFQIALNSAGEYILSVFYFGNKASDVPFSIKDGQKTTDLGTIKVADVSQLEESLVVAQKPLVKVEIDKLTYDTESDPDSRTETALEMLKKVPMLTVDGEDNIQLNGSTNFKVYVNGKPSTMITNRPSEVLRSMPASNIKNIEVITDPGAKYEAEGIGGIINIIMAKNSDDGYTATVGANVNTQGGYGANASLILKQGKLGFSGNYGYNRWVNPAMSAESVRNNYADGSINRSIGSSENKSPSHWGNMELSYEIDTLNLVTISADIWTGKYTNTNTTFNELIGGSNPYSYLRNTENKGKYGDIELGANYQRSFKKKGMLLTASYEYENSPDDSEYETILSEQVSYRPLWERSKNEAASNEHTFQLDYVNPIKDKHTLEVGAKYIIRLNDSDPFFEEYSYGTSLWERNPERENTMDYRQNILSGYGSYSYKLKKMGLKAGVRVENTETDINFKTLSDVKYSTTDVVPSAALSYQLAPTKTLRLNYNMRISRPSIWYLNPYVDRSNPTDIRYGEPGLDSEHSHNVSLTFSSFSQKFNLNASLRYSFSNNSIQEYSFMDADTLKTTYGNIGKNQSLGMNLYGSWTPIKDLRLMVNGWFSYQDINSTMASTPSNYGFGGGGHANATYTFLKSFRANISAGYFQMAPMLQTERSAFIFLGMGLGKDFFDKKLSLNINVQDPFVKNRKMTTKTTGVAFNQESIMLMERQNVSFRISYRFGNLKNQQIKKVERGINNDDVMQGGNNNSGGTGNTTN